MTHSALPLEKQSEQRFSVFRVVQTAAFIGFGATSLALLLDIIDGARTFGRLWLIPVVVIVAYALADLLSGVVHFLADNFGSPETPLFGKAFVMPFRDHHVDPKGILQHPFMIANGNNCLVSLPPLLAVLFLVPVEETFGGYLFGLFSLALCLAVFLTNQFHKWAHMDDPPRAVAWLQSRGLILSREHHDVHHASPFDTYYCITAGWWNPMLQRTRVFERITPILKKILPG
jgi:hypothetical protein